MSERRRSRRRGDRVTVAAMAAVALCAWSAAAAAQGAAPPPAPPSESGAGAETEEGAAPARQPDEVESLLPRAPMFRPRAAFPGPASFSDNRPFTAYGPFSDMMAPPAPASPPPPPRPAYRGAPVPVPPPPAYPPPAYGAPAPPPPAQTAAGSGVSAQGAPPPAPARARPPVPAPAQTQVQTARADRTAAENPPLGILSEARFGALYHDAGLFGRTEESDGFDVNLEFLFVSPEFLEFLWSPRPHIGGHINTAGDTSQGYFGLTWEWWLWEDVFFDFAFGFSVHDGETETTKLDTKELGSRILFREAIDLGWMFTESDSLSFFLDHVSHGGLLGDVNEGLDTIGVRYGRRF